jgi:hypothetical protein
MNDFLYFCPSRKTIYEIVRHRVRPLTARFAGGAGKTFRLLTKANWLNYRQMRPRFERTE